MCWPLRCLLVGLLHLNRGPAKKARQKASTETHMPGYLCPGLNYVHGLDAEQTGPD